MGTWNDKVKDIVEYLNLDLHPQAVKMLTAEDEIPASAIRAGEQFGHLAYCQAAALAKRDGMTVYMGKKDHWCWATLVGFGMVDCSPESPAFDALMPFLGIKDKNKAPEFFAHFPQLPEGKYTGTVIAPAETADFEPDVILINCNNNFQLRSMFMAIKNQTGKMLDAQFEALDSCVYTVVKSIVTGDYTVAIPDPGDQERALATSNEIILGVPFSRLDELHEGMQEIERSFGSYRSAHMCMEFDYARPAFYNQLFELWGLEKGRDWMFEPPVEK